MIKFLIFTLLIVFLFDNHHVGALPTASTAVKYLQKFGYLNVPDSRTGTALTSDKIEKGIRLFQRFTGLPETGSFDQTTLNKMEQPRCGNPDIIEKENSRRKRRYVLQGSKWNKKRITYKFDSYTKDLKPSETRKAIAKAFETWAETSSLSFKSTISGKQADIVIKFASGFHGDSSVFDGPGGVLAHAYFPQFGGDAHFDEDEHWVITKGRGVKLTVVAAHEFGHSLGLGHSENPKALMAPYYDPRISKLHEDDITGIQALYGPPTDRQLINYGRSQPSCLGKLDAITTLKNGSIFAFSGDFFWKVDDQGVDKDSKQPIENVWGFRGAIDACLTHNGFTDLFQGVYVRRFIDDKSVHGYPKLISDQYPGIPSHIDAAWAKHDIIYFIKGSEYWTFDTSTGETTNVSTGLTSAWGDLPDSIDASLHRNNLTYFFKDGLFWRFGHTRDGLTLEESYPQSTEMWMTGCSEDSANSSSEKKGGNGAGSRLKAGKSLPVAILFILFTLSVQY